MDTDLSEVLVFKLLRTETATTTVPSPAIVARLCIMILIELIQHDIRQQRRYYASLRHTFTGRPKETDINVSRLDRFLQQGHETCVTDPAAYGFHQQAMVYGVGVTG